MCGCPLPLTSSRKGRRSITTVSTPWRGPGARMADSFDDLRDLYQEVILDHGRRPRHAHKPESFDASAKGDNPMCGDRIEVWVKYAPDGTIGDAGFQAR